MMRYAPTIGTLYGTKTLMRTIDGIHKPRRKY